MRISKVIELADEMKPNALSRELKIQFISECEGMIQSDIMLLSPDDIIVYEPSGSDDPELLAKPPHDKIYIAYLTAMIDYALGEYNKYANTIALFNAYFAEYTAWYANRYHPIDGMAEASGYYLRGATPQLRNNAGAIEWKYDNEPDDAWRVLVTRDELQGAGG